MSPRKHVPRSRAPRRRRGAPPWVGLPDERLLDLRFCDLGLRIEETRIPERLEKLAGELERRRIRFRPHCWLSTEWFSPDGVPGFGVPFYLAHPRLMQLEYRQMIEVEGGTEESCMQILRHEAGHAIDTAYRLHRRKRWRELFGRFTKPYPEWYQPKPYSKRYVLHLDWWYAQSHPAEDFAETFAIWLKPGSGWRRSYEGWPALRKLEYVDELMTEIAGTRPAVVIRDRVEPLSKVRKTLREHYQEKLAHYEGDYPEIYDRDLRRLFSDAPVDGGRRSAAAFLRRTRPQLRRSVAHGTGEHPYPIDQVLGEMILRCRELKLYVNRSEEQVRLEAAILLTAQTINYLHQSGRHRVPL